MRNIFVEFEQKLINVKKKKNRKMNRRSYIDYRQNRHEKALVSFQRGLNSVNHLPFEYRPRNAQSFPTWARNSLETRSSNIFARKCTHKADIDGYECATQFGEMRAGDREEDTNIPEYFHWKIQWKVDTFCVCGIRGNMGMTHSKSYYPVRSFLPILSFRSIQTFRR